MHKSVLVNEVIEYLNIKPSSKIIDATIDGGGHTKAILERYQDANILGIEWDPILYREISSTFQASSFTKLIITNDSYTNLERIVKDNEFYPDGILFDFGLSSWHYEKSGRGFSFMRNELLDMRHNPEIQVLTAMDLVNKSDTKELERILSDYGEEKFAHDIAENIVQVRNTKPIIMTSDLVSVIESSVPWWYKRKKINPSTKTFQALRIAVNDELKNVKEGILAAINVLSPSGRLVAISFHGLEDKTVRDVFKTKSKLGEIKFIKKGTIRPSWDEQRSNPRSRSAKMKVVEKIV